MSDSTVAFELEIRKVITYFRNEFDLSYAAAIGVLEIVKHDLISEALDTTEEEEEEEEDDVY